jgi:DNA-binding response OmpR family regulator
VASKGEQKTALQNCSVLIVEDEATVAMLLEDFVLELGCHVTGIAARVDTALTLIEVKNLDVVILDVNLEGEASYPVANELERRKIPFLFATGYGAQAIPEEYRWHTVLQKPFRKQELEAALLEVLRGAPKMA